MTLALDHIAVAAANLSAGVAAVEAALGLPLGPGGRHAAMGTHNRLLSLGPEHYLEVIAVDPDAPPPGRGRWFGLDAFAGPPRLAAWIIRVADLDTLLRRLPPEWGAPLALSRGPYRWRMAVPTSGAAPLGGIAPALIEWQGATPAAALPEAGCRLLTLSVSHPEIASLLAAIPALDALPDLRFSDGPPGLVASIAAPGGTRRLA